MTLPMLFHTRRARVLARLVLYGGALLVGLPVALSQMMLGTVRQPSHPVAPPFEESWVRSEGLRLRAWTVRGRPERAAVVVAHGLGDTLESFTGVAERLHERARSVCSGDEYDQLHADVVARRLDPWAASDRLLAAAE